MLEKAESKPPAKTHSRTLTYFTANTLSAVSTTLLLNKCDEMLYLSIKNHRSFLHPANLSVPYFQGFWATLGQRLMTNGVYFVAQREFMQSLYPVVTATVSQVPMLAPISDTAGAISVGFMSGVCNAMMTNPAAAVKYEIWNGADNGESRGFFRSAAILWKTGGLANFYTAFYPTIRREISFGSTNEILRSLFKKMLPEKNQHQTYALLPSPEFLCSMAASFVAGGMCAEWNYVRTHYFGAPNKKQQKSPAILLQELKQDVLAHSDSSVKRAIYKANRLGIGWGTFFNAIRMALGQSIFDNTPAILNHVESFFKKRPG